MYFLYWIYRKVSKLIVAFGNIDINCFIPESIPDEKTRDLDPKIPGLTLPVYVF